MQIISNVALITINETLIVQLISFLVFLFIINRIMFRPLVSSMDDRHQKMEGIKTDIDETKQKMEDILVQLKKKEADVRNEANTIKKELEEEGSKAASEIYADFRKTAADLTRKTAEEVNSQIMEARRQLEKESEALSKQIMEKILDRRLA